MQVLHLQQRRRLDRWRRADSGSVAAIGAIHTRHRLQQHARIRMLRRREQFAGVAALDRLAMAHHHDAIRHPRDHAHVVCDQNQPRASLALQLVHQVEHLRLHRHVQRRRRLVRQQHLWFAQHGGGNHHALAHPARQLVRKLVQAAPRLGNAHALQPFNDALLGVTSLEILVTRQYLSHLRANRHVRRQRRQRVLKDHADLRAADFVQLLARHARKFLAIELDRARDNAIARRQPHRRQHSLALARPALADQPEALPPRHVERQLLHRLDKPVRRLERHRQVAHIKNGRGSCHRILGSGLTHFDALSREG